MAARWFTAALLVAGLAVAGCGGSDDSPVSVPADPVEGAAPGDDIDDTAPDPTETQDADVPDDAAAEEPAEATTDPPGDPTGEAPGEENDADGGTDAADEQMFPDVIDATASSDGSTWTVAATLSSPYDTPDRYADAWRVVGPDGTVYGERILAHDHANEQPFTRSESGIEIPEDVTTVTIEGRDLQFGYGGDTFELALPR